MKQYQEPKLETWELTADEAFAAVIKSEPIVEDNENLNVDDE